ncbi:Zn-ribbon domain-containing OB-fold protein [Pseudonocardia sp. Cha107L01]|jgi:hypothetical protein|uniref:Zn-ribbon domain-containing OB-fold protein n=1 Tax=Pseudonocardia sp. Cha107L01 TaxID=3457576 RepID=UPI00403EB04D
MPNISVRRDEASAPFFDATATGQLLIKTCPNCHQNAIHRAQQCRGCGTKLTWLPASGDATLITWSATPPARDDPDQPVTIFGYVELTEGPWLETLLVDATLDTLSEGMPMRATFIRQHGDDEHIPAFRPA